MVEAIVLVSGGYDSALALELVLEQYGEVAGLFANYGQPYYEREREAIGYLEEVCFEKYSDEFLGIDEVRCDMRLSDKPVPDYIPMRNLVLCSLAVNHVQSRGGWVVAHGCKSEEYREGDAHSFRDSTAVFFSQFGVLARSASEDCFESVRVLSPVEGYSKADIAAELHNRGYDLGRLWNCYSPGDEPCLSCHQCESIMGALKDAELWNEYSHRWE